MSADGGLAAARSAADTVAAARGTCLVAAVGPLAAVLERDGGAADVLRLDGIAPTRAAAVIDAGVHAGAGQRVVQHARPLGAHRLDLARRRARVVQRADLRAEAAVSAHGARGHEQVHVPALAVAHVAARRPVQRAVDGHAVAVAQPAREAQRDVSAHGARQLGGERERHLAGDLGVASALGQLGGAPQVGALAGPPDERRRLDAARLAPVVVDDAGERAAEACAAAVGSGGGRGATGRAADAGEGEAVERHASGGLGGRPPEHARPQDAKACPSGSPAILRPPPRSRRWARRVSADARTVVGMSDHEYQRERRRATAHAEVQAEAASLARVRADAARAALDCVPVALERLCPGVGRVSADERARLALAALAYVADAMLDAGKLPAFRALLAARAQAHGDVAAAVAFGAEPPAPTATVNLSPAEREAAGREAWVKAGAERWAEVQRAAPSLAEDVTLDALRRDVGEDGGRER